MITIDRDYGNIGYDNPSTNKINITPRRLVWQATHTGVGENRLPLMNRSFISFTYGGMPIEDFDLIATITNDRMEKNGYSSFNDLVTTYDNLDGQLYWKTHFTNHSLTFKLATDGIEEKTLEKFLYWFLPGVSRMLVLAEHPNRAQYARVLEPPQLSLLPFKHSTNMTIDNANYPIITTLYKGEITLTLIMDDPHWFAIDNILGTLEGDHYTNYWKDPTDPNSELTYIFSSPDAMKILYEDNIPLGSLIEGNMFLGNNTYADITTHAYNNTWSIAEENLNYIDDDPCKPSEGEGARIEGRVDGVDYYGRIAGAIIDASGNGISVARNAQSATHFYYAGTAPAPTVISFTLTPELGSYYIITPVNKTNDVIHSHTGAVNPYNTITIESVNKLLFKFTTPNVFTSYNYVIDIFNNEINGENNWEKIYSSIRDKVRHPMVRAWATKVLDYYKGADNNSTAVATSRKTALKTAMTYFLKKLDGTLAPATFTFNSKTGEAMGEFNYRQVGGNVPTSNDPFATYGNNVQVTEDVGDMLHSNYVIITERNHPNALGKIVIWDDDPRFSDGHEYSHRVYHDVFNGLDNFTIKYQNMYL